MTLDDYLSRESAYFKDLRRWDAVWFVFTLGWVVSLKALQVALPADAAAVLLMLLLVVGWFVGFAFYGRVATRTLSARHDLFCPHCQQPLIEALAHGKLFNRR